MMFYELTTYYPCDTLQRMRTRARPSIEEIAKLSGCSKATVDRVLHGRAGVHPRTRDKVNQALAQLEAEYEIRAPEPFGASSSSGAFQRLGFIIQAGQAFTESFLTDYRETAKR